MISRRSFVQSTSLAAAFGTLGQAAQLQTIGFQLYTVRTIFPQKPAETLKALDAIGYRELEGTYAERERTAKALEGTSIKPVSMHLDSAMVTKDKPEDLPPALEALKKMGYTYAVMPYLPPAERGGLDVIKALAGRLNQVAEKCRAAGLRFAYHNHAFEFEPMDGTTPFQVLLDNTDKQLVNIEMDLFWVSVAGHDPVEMLGKVKGRVPLVHLKDKAPETPVMYKESIPRTAFKEVGHGNLDWPAVLRAAASAGVEHYFVEQDQTPGDPVESLRQSYEFLSKLKY